MFSIIARRSLHATATCCKRSRIAISNQSHDTSHLVTTDNKTYQLIAFPQQAPIPKTDLALADKTFMQPVRFVKSISAVSQAPTSSQPEVAFVGRSNVGKSTAINQLTSNSKLAKTSSKPGHTRLLNFFDVGGKVTLVDMPGYGYRSREEWGDLVLEYLSSRSQLRRLFILVDPTAGLKETDRQLMTYLDEHGLSYQIILTKRDKLTEAAFEKSKASIEKSLVESAMCCYPHILTIGKRRRSKNNETQVANDVAHVRWSILNAAGLLPSKTVKSP
ncbi:hypothetical protein EC973_008555 [Apophysomyces ossiformis]|uniref:GTP-binding protein 8 n=1 Tax=Apophysomyces ossiformis TaxID=679940 RepID=A0A8H7ETM5_9FUNG|nr:hypothetical protein EC973_008555 [Apophysomyces ossiformis]